MSAEAAAELRSSTLADAEELSRTLWRLARELQERHPGGEGVVLCGIPTRGVHLARRLQQLIVTQGGVEWAGLTIDVGPYRDDLTSSDRSRVAATDSRWPLPAADPAGVEGRVVILVDDVLYHGRTARAALVALAALARPSAVELLVLVDRGHRELPLRATYVGRNLPTAASDRILVRLEEEDGLDAILIASAAEGGK